MDTKSFVSELKRRRPFDRVPEVHLLWLAERMEPVEFSEGSIILSPGEPCTALYIIHSGIVQLEAVGSTADNLKILAELVEGESFPLEALEEARPVFSTFRAKVTTSCYSLSLDDFLEFKKLDKVFSDFCHYRSTSFLEQSRRVYKLHFSNQSEEQQRLSMPLSLLMKPEPPTAKAGWTVREVVAPMYEQDTDATVIIDDESRPIGIFTIRDLLRKVIIPGMDLYMPVEKAMTPSPKTLHVSALGYEAALMLAEEEFHHVVLVNEGRLAGVVSERELFNLQRVSLSQINAQIRLADSIDQLKECHRDIRLLSENMLIQGATADQMTQIISSLNDQVITRALDLEFAPRAPSTVKVCWVALGSEGRHEQTLTTDQDNGIIFEHPEGMTPDQARALLLPLAENVNRALAHIGFPLCEGNIMAMNPDCCLSYKEWQKRFNTWISEPTPEALLNASIFFDFRFLYGVASHADRLRTWLADAVKGQNRFFHLLVENALQRTPPLGFFRDFVVDDHADCAGSIDIKASGVTLFVDAARVYALAQGVTRSNSRQRLLMSGDQRRWPQSDVNAWMDAFSFLQSLRIRHHFELHRNGCESHNRLNPYELNNLDRRFLLESLRQAGKLQKQLKADFSQLMM
ncbi:MAG TPA: CBS domain-containing protein [Desulfuromonadales bacterium]|nr:CBS domain-containing protein [Desulfuromonadales bacterium]